MGALDKKLREKMQLEVVDIIERVGVTCVMVTHDQEEAMTMAGRIAIMDRGEFVQIGNPEEIYEHPNCRLSAEFIGSVNIFEGVLEEGGPDYMVIRTDSLTHPVHVNHGAAVADGVHLMVALRPEKIFFSNEIPSDHFNYDVGTVENIAYMGDISIYHVRLPSGQIVIATLPNVDRFRKGQPTWGDQVILNWEPDSCVVLTI